MARTIWFSNWNFLFFRLNGKYPKSPHVPKLKDMNMQALVLRSAIPVFFGISLTRERIFPSVSELLRKEQFKATLTVKAKQEG